MCAQTENLHDVTRAHRDTLILTLVAVGLFFVSIIVRFCLADFPKCIGVLPDEIRYLNLASSLFNEGQLIERGGFSSFQKILYPFTLFPAYLTDDPLLRVRLIALLNSVYVSSAVFPALLIARKLFTGKVPVIICLFFTVIMPDMCYSMTFLSECIYLPLVLWLVLCCWQALEKRGKAAYLWCFGAGLLSFITYLAKEVALGFVLAFIVLMIVRIVREWGYETKCATGSDPMAHKATDTVTGDAENNPGILSGSASSAMRSCEDCLSAPQTREFPAGLASRRRSSITLDADRARKQARIILCVPLFCFLMGFIIPFLIFKFTLFAGLLNSYNQTDPSVLLNPYTVLFALYALVSDTTHFVIAFAFFPLVLPALTWSRLTKRERELYLFCLLSFVFILLIVVYTISIREDLGHVGIRPHVRYVAPIFLPLLFLTIKQIARGDGSAIMRSPLAFAAAVASTLAMCLLAVFMLGSGDYSQGFDSAQFHPLRLLGEQLPGLPIDPNADPSASTTGKDIYHGGFLTISPGIWLAKALVCAYLIFGMWALASRRFSKAAAVVPVLIALAMVACNVGAYQYNNAVYRADVEKVAEMCALVDFVDGVPEGEQVLIVVDDENSAFNNLMDVYLDNDRMNCTYILEKQLRAALEEGPVMQRELLLETGDTMGDNIFDVNGRTCDDEAGISYIVTPASQRLRFTEDCAQDVTPEQLGSIVVYRIAPDASLALAPSALHASSIR